MTEAASERGLPGAGLGEGGGLFQIRRRCWAANQARAAPALGHRQQRRRLWRWEPSKHTLNSFLIADFLLGSSCRQGCFHFLLPPPPLPQPPRHTPHPESSMGRLLPTFNQSLYHLSHLLVCHFLLLPFFFFTPPHYPLF